MTRISIPKTQVLSSPTFIPPVDLLEDPEKTLLDIYQWNATRNASHVLFRYQDGEDIKEISWKDAVQAVRNAASYFASHAEKNASTAARPPVVAILATSDTITYFCAIFGLLWAGYTAFPISPRNSVEAISDLLSRTGASHLYVSTEPRIAEVATSALETLNSKSHARPVVEMHAVPIFEHLFDFSASTSNSMIYPRERDIDTPLIILHSSGSTAFPKPIAWTARRIKQWTLLPWYGEIDFCGLVMGCHAMPMFHGMGIFQATSAASSGFIIACFRPASPPVLPTSVNVFQEAIATGSDFICCVPSFVEEWATDPSKVALIKTSKGLIFGGGPLSQATGDKLASEGIALYQNYGCTEVCVINKFLLGNPGMDWDYLEMSKHLRAEFVPYGDGTFELVVVATDIWRPAVINTNFDGHDAYATKDLFIPHTTKPGLWKIFGRADDQIMLSTGEKTNPGPLESILAQDPHIQSGVMFGRGRFHNGLIVDPVKLYGFDPRDADMLAQFRNTIWPTIEKMNTFAPQHSRIFKEMIMVASPSKPFTYTAKGTTRRQAIISDYADEIEQLYASFNDRSTHNIEIPSSWTYKETLGYVRHLVSLVLDHQLPDDSDIFQHGCDSLQAAWIRNNILRSLAETGKTVALPPNFVYQALSISGVARMVSDAATSTVSRNHAFSQIDRVQELLNLVSHFTSNFPSRPSPVLIRPNGKDVVLLTGSTGAFGCHILAELIADVSVEKVYVLNKGLRSRDRQSNNIRKQGLDMDCLLSPKVHFLEGDLSAATLGLDMPTYKEIQSSVTHIIHTAWKVDFNQSVKSFERLLIGLRNLVDVALLSPYEHSPRVLFISSVGVIRRAGINGYIKEEPIHDVTVPTGIGYTESKWVGEQILEEAVHAAGLRGTIVRPGQLCGSSNGSWNEREWFPTLVQAAEYLGCLPDVDDEGLVTWIPSLDAAKALLQIRNSPELVMHLAHPKPVPWKTFMTPLANALHVPLVPYKDWLASLEACAANNRSLEDEGLQKYPALRLLDFFRNAEIHEDKEPLGVARLDTEKATRESVALRTAPQLTGEWASRWLNAWKASGHLTREDVRV